MNISQKFKLSKSKRLFETLKFSAIASCLALASQVTFAADYSRAEKELRIMSKIFETSISDSRNSNNRRDYGRSSREIESTYLAKQGMVFTFSFSRSRFGDSNDWQAFGEGIGNLVGSITRELAHSMSDINVSPVVPIAPIAPLSSFEWNDHDFEANVEAYAHFQDSLENLREDQRDKQEEVRDLQRSIRDIERRARREEVDAKKLSSTKKKLEAKIKSLEVHRTQYEKSMQEYRDKKIKNIKVSNQKKSDLIISTLCDYGSTLRSLDNGQYVTLVFSNFEKSKDQIFVFNYKDVKSCSNKDKLIKKAISYQI